MALGLARVAVAHHSFAMYDVKKTYVMTGIVTRIDPNPNHLQIFFAPLNEARDQVLKDDTGEPIVWAVAGPDLPAGQKVRITGAEGALLKVEPATQAA